MAYAGVRGGDDTGRGRSAGALWALVSCNYFDVLRQPPTIGRPLAAQDCEPGVSPLDPVALAGAALVVLGVGLRAAVMAARPATRADLITALRQD